MSANQASAPPLGSAVVRVREDDLRTQYINVFRVAATGEEAFVDVGVTGVRTVPASAGRPAQAWELRFETRLLMNMFTLKRMAISLSRLVREYEAAYGELRLDDRRRTVTTDESGTHGSHGAG